MPSAEETKQVPPEPGRPSGSRSPRGVELRFDPSHLIGHIFIICVLAEVTLLVLDYHVNYGRWTEISPIRRLFNITREDGLASWFAVTQTLLVALTLWLIFICVRNRGGSRWRTIGWLVLALFFTYLAVDDGAALHERLGSTFREMQTHASDGQDAKTWGATLLEIFPSYPWQIVFMPIFGAVGLFILVFLWREFGDRSAKALLAIGLSCFVLAVGLDFIEGLKRDHPWNLYTLISNTFELDDFTRRRFNHSAYTTLRHFSKSIEETIEMLGMTVLWVVFLRHWTRIASSLHVRFEKTPPT